MSAPAVRKGGAALPGRTTFGQLTKEQREGLIADEMRSRGWTPPSQIAMEQMKDELKLERRPVVERPQYQQPQQQMQYNNHYGPHQLQGNVMAPQNMRSGQYLPAMANPYGGMGVGNIQTALTADGFANWRSAQYLPPSGDASHGVTQNEFTLLPTAAQVDPLIGYNMHQVAYEMAKQYQNVSMAGNAPVNTLPSEIFLRSTFVEGKVLQRIAPMLIFLDMATQFTTDSIDLVWFRHNFSPDTDPDARGPIPMGEDSLFPRATIGDPVKKMGSIGMWGLAIDFTRKALRYTNTAVDDIQRKIDWAAWKFAHKINSIYGNVLTGGFSTSQTGNDAVIVEAADNTWNDPGANPFKDLRDLIFKMQTENGHYFEPNEIWLTPAQFRELMDYSDTVDHDWATRPINANGQSIVRDFDGVAIRRAPPASGIPDGFGIMLARNTGPQFGLPLTVWDAVDSEFTRTGMLHTDRYRHPETKKVSVLMWKEFFVANRNPKAVGLLHSM